MLTFFWREGGTERKEEKNCSQNAPIRDLFHKYFRLDIILKTTALHSTKELKIHQNFITQTERTKKFVIWSGMSCSGCCSCHFSHHYFSSGNRLSMILVPISKIWVFRQFYNDCCVCSIIVLSYYIDIHPIIDSHSLHVGTEFLNKIKTRKN